MTYFSYHPEQTAAILIGTDVEQLINTLKHYNLSIPTNGDIRQLTRVKIICSLGIPINKHFFHAEVRDHVSFRVHENAFQYIKGIAENFENLKRGGLYKFDPGHRDYGILFLPRYIMEGLNEYDWDQHLEQIEEWLETEKIISDRSCNTSKFLIKPA
jgi:hypothetical protein